MEIKHISLIMLKRLHFYSLRIFRESNLSEVIKKNSSCLHFLVSIVPLIPHVKNDGSRNNYVEEGMNELIDEQCLKPAIPL